MKLNLGCGKRNFPGWTNVDIADYSHVHYKFSVDDLSMFDDATADIIYSSHTFGYFDRFEALEVLREWSRVLKSNGLIRLAVPDFEKLIKVYNSTGEINDIVGPMYGRMEIKSDQNQLIYHKIIYDFRSLKTLLIENGFKDIRRYDWRDTEHTNFDDHSQAYFPHMEADNRLFISLNIEAGKC